MKIHEYQAKELFRQYGIPCPNGGIATTLDEARRVVDAMPGYPVMVKAQIHAGGRGKGGGVKLATSPADLEERVAEILGMTLITAQTGPAGKVVHTVLLEQGLDLAQELYLSLAVDRRTAQILIIASATGGMEIETTATADPGTLVRIEVNPLSGLADHHLRRTAFGLGLTGEEAKHFTILLRHLYHFFVDCDCLLVEINPLVITTDGQVLALDAKVEIDSSALFRHPDLASLYDPTEEDPFEAEARVHNVNYIKLNGTIGNMVNGAGLAMATMDLIKNAGAEPANFLDVGGGATADMVEHGFRLILADPEVRGILINIFGGILRCDVLAAGIVEAATKTGITLPVVIRMEGTNVEEGRKILAASGLNLITAADLSDAAQKIALVASGDSL
ncbi:MAG: ADP-forming succinate--CoA ligase subunit beta [Proteobacteria bacterium]|nr:ADP-forming succinate--CoA ligase subunit beta [Pseudomonadota bacterium]MBU1688099.1 ADP-forming succinate--CoA ligase subunit beta [Pseudomonadota bacterium]